MKTLGKQLHRKTGLKMEFNLLLNFKGLLFNFEEIKLKNSMDKVRQ